MVAYIRMCGVYCPQCRGFKEGKCKGTEENCEKTTCDMFKCLKAKEIRYCFQCNEFPDRKQCNIFSKSAELWQKFNVDIEGNLKIIQKSKEKGLIKQMKK